MAHQQHLSKVLLDLTDTALSNSKPRPSLDTYVREGGLDYRVERLTPMDEALTVTAAGVLLSDFAILLRPAFCFAIDLRVLRSSFDHNTRPFAFLAIFTPEKGFAF